MSNSGNGVGYFWCLRHHRVETDVNVCVATDRLGPYPSARDAQRALERVGQRNAAWDAEDVRWQGENA